MIEFVDIKFYLQKFDNMKTKHIEPDNARLY